MNSKQAVRCGALKNAFNANSYPRPILHVNVGKDLPSQLQLPKHSGPFCENDRRWRINRSNALKIEPEAKSASHFNKWHVCFSSCLYSAFEKHEAQGKMGGETKRYRDRRARERQREEEKQ